MPRFDSGSKGLFLTVLGFFLVSASFAIAQDQPTAGSTWKFAISGDSRNCGDIVMPAIAAGVLKDGAAFYWHLGDYRAIYMFDEDYARTHPNSTARNTGSAPLLDFRRTTLSRRAWLRRLSAMLSGRSPDPKQLALFSAFIG